MKSRIIKILISVAALLFFSSTVSLAHDWNKRHHKRQGKAYGHYKAEKHYPKWSKKLFKLLKIRPKHYRNQHLAGYYCEDGFYHFYDKRDRRWKNEHLKHRRHQRDRYGYKKSHRADTYYRRHAPREDVVYKVALKNSKIGVTVLKNGRKIYR
jgi:hypothetical protein